LGGEELKLPIFALLLLGAGLLVQLPSISAQEIPVTAEDPLRAAEQSFTISDSSPDMSPASGSSTWAIIRMVLILALAAAAIYGVVFFIKKSARKTDISDPFLKILATSHLGSNRYAHIVAVGSKAWLLGSSDGGVNLIGEIDDKDVINAMLLEDSRKTAEGQTGRFPDFVSLMRRLGTPADSRASGADEIRRRRNRLKGF